MTVSDPTKRAAAADERRRRLAEVLRARRTAPAPLAPNQERLFVLQQLEPESTAYAESVVLRLHGALQADVLLSVLHALPTRHEWLRSRVEATPDGPVQMVDDSLRATVLHTELPPAGGGSRRELGPAARAWVRSLVEVPFPLDVGPPWRAGLARLGDDDHVLVLVVHHVACDATSLAVLVDEIGRRYDAALSGSSPELRRPRSPGELARTVRALQSSEAAQAAVVRAATGLAGADLDARPRGSSSPDATPGPAETCRGRVPRPVADRVARVAVELDATPFALVSVAVGLALAEAADVDTPVLGVPVDLRFHLDAAEETVSFLVETAAIALPDVRGRSLAESVRTVGDAVAASLTQPPHFAEVVAALRDSGALARTGTPLHAYLTWLDGEESPTLGRRGPAVTHVDLPLGQAKFDLSWTAISRGGELDLRLEYDSARLDRGAADRLVARAITLLDAATDDPEAALGGMDLLSPAELTQVLAWEGTAAEPPASDLFTTVRDGIAGATGPVLVTGAEEMTGTDLLARVDRLAAALRASGVGPGSRVAVPSRRVAGMVVALLAVLRSGGTFVPVDVTHPAVRQAELARAARVVAVVGERAWADRLAATVDAAVVAVDDGGRPESPAPTEQSWKRRGPDDLAYVMFTSGSTGRPKAVRVPDGAVVARIDSYREVLAAEGVRHLVQSSLTFDASIYLFWALATGGCLVLPADGEAADPVALTRLIARHGVTDAFFVPALYEAVLRVAQPGDLDSCRRLCIGGDVVPPALAGLHATQAPHATFLNVYGPTEVVVTSTSATISADSAASGQPLSIGRPHPGTVARVLDRRGRRVPVGMPGELHLGGPCVADGYDRTTGSPEDRDPFSVRDEDGRSLRWYATGDLVRWRDDGSLDYLGRRDRQVKLRGQRVELGEIEAALRRLPGAREAAVEFVGSGDGRRLVAFVAPEVPDALRTLAAVLPAAWLPDLVVTRQVLPHLPSGKLDRARLRDAAAAHVQRTDPVPARGGRGTGLERTVLSIVRALLQDDRIGLDDDFFAVGGNSLLAARLMGQLSAMVGIAVPLHELVGNSTIRGIAALADRESAGAAAEAHESARLLPVRETGSLPPLVLVGREGATTLVLQHFVTRIDADRPVWVVLRPLPALGHRGPDLVADGAEVARVLRERFADGPVHVLGHSASGIVALEAARALGSRRGVTILLDTVPPAPWTVTPVWRLAHVARMLVRRSRMWRAGIRRPSADGSSPAPRSAESLRVHQDYRASVRARVRPVDFPVTLLAATETQEELGRGDLGWGRLGVAPDIRSVATDHTGLLLQPDVFDTVAMIDRTLSEWR